MVRDDAEGQAAVVYERHRHLLEARGVLPTNIFGFNHLENLGEGVRNAVRVAEALGVDANDGRVRDELFQLIHVQCAGFVDAYQLEGEASLGALHGEVGVAGDDLHLERLLAHGLLDPPEDGLERVIDAASTAAADEALQSFDALAAHEALLKANEIVFEVQVAD